MTDFLASSLLGYLYLVSTGALIFIIYYNYVVCPLDRSLVKTTLRNMDGVFFTSVCIVPLVYRRDPLVGQLLTLSPRDDMAWAILLGAAFVWIVYFAFQAAVTYRLFRPKKIPFLLSRDFEPHPFQPEKTDWDVYRDPDVGRSIQPTRPDRKKPPKNRRRLSKLKVRPWISHLFFGPGFGGQNDAYKLDVVRIALEFPNLPASFDGLRLLQLADPHFGQDLSPRYYRHAIEKAVELDADMVLLTGDFTGHDNLYRQAVALFQPLDPPMGTWAILGNHDYYTEPDLIGYWLEHDGIQRLDNRHVEFTRKGEGGRDETLRLIGTEHPHDPVRDWDGLMGEGGREIFRLVMSHRPDTFKKLTRAGADLVLSGHTHGGQWRLPLIGPFIVPSLYGRRYVRGLYQEASTVQYTSSGFGIHTIPFRYRCPPEITLFELRRKNPR